MAKVHMETDHDRISRLTKTISVALHPEDTKGRKMAFYCTECGIVFQNIEDKRTHESTKHKEVQSKVSVNEEVFSTGAKIIPDTDFITMNTADLKLMLEAIPAEVLNYEEDVFEKDFKEVLNSEKVKAEKDCMQSYPCDECNFRATSRRCLKTHMTFVHSPTFYRCKHCTLKTRTDNALQYHIDMKHNTYWEDGQEEVGANLLTQKKEDSIEDIKETENQKNENTEIKLKIKLEAGTEMFDCEFCDKSFLTDRGLVVHSSRMHKENWRSKDKISHNLEFNIERKDSMTRSPPAKKSKDKSTNVVEVEQMTLHKNAEELAVPMNTDFDDSECRINNLVKKNESLNSLLITREDQIQKQANQISYMKNSITKAKEVVNDANVDMLERDIHTEERKEYIAVLETKVEELKKENEVASKHLIDMDKVNQDRLQQLKNTIEKQVEVISNMTKELDKYTTPKNTPTAKIVAPPSVENMHVLAAPTVPPVSASPVTNGVRMEQDGDEINGIHASKASGFRREGPQTGAIPKMPMNRDKQPKLKLNCTECSETRSSEAPMEAHMSCHREPGMHKCDDCTYKSNEKNHMRNHLKHTRHTGTFKEYVCHECRLEFNSEQEEKNHKETHEPEGATAAATCQAGAVIECPICGFIGKTKNKIEEHMACHDKDEEDSSYLCGDCSYQAMNRDQLLEHLEKKHDKHICNSCNIACISKNELKKHIGESHRSHKPCRDYATNSCEYAECRFRHIKLRENEHICYKCGVRSSTIKDLMMHIREIHGSEPCTKFAKGECDRNLRCWYSHSRLPTRAQKQSYSQEDFREGPTARRPVIDTRSPTRAQVHQVSENIQKQKITEVTQKVLAQIMPSLVKQIMETVNC